MKSTDYQKSKVYKWEDMIIGKQDNTHISPEEAQDLVNFIWANEGYNHPPKISLEHRKQSGADATRIELRFTTEALRRWIVIHEVAHSLEQMNIDSENTHPGYAGHDGHGPKFVSRYINLLEKYMYFPKLLLWYTLKEAKIDFNKSF